MTIQGRIWTVTITFIQKTLLLILAVILAAHTVHRSGLIIVHLNGHQADDPLKKYNGLVGEVVRYDEKMRRWVVKMTHPETKESKLIVIRAVHLVDLDLMVNK